MSHSVEPGSVGGGTATPPDPPEPSIAQLVTQLSEQSSRLVRDEIKLATVELQEKAKRAGIGAGLFGVAGAAALFGAGALTACAILLLDLVLDAWLAALIVAVLLFVVAGILALVGKKQVQRATPALPAQSIASVKRDVETVKEAAHR